jgi:hypothetical protein
MANPENNSTHGKAQFHVTACADQKIANGPGHKGGCQEVLSSAFHVAIEAEMNTSGQEK